MSGYDAKKAETFNQLRQQGLSEDQAAAQAGIGANDFANYAVGDNGKLGPLIAGTGTVTQAPTAAAQAESARFAADLASPSNFEQVDYAQTARSTPGSTKPVTYTTTSTETVSGGGSTTIVAGPRQPTVASQAAGNAYTAKTAEYDEFIKKNPSDFARKRQGLPPMTPEEKAEYDKRLNTLKSEKEALKNAQIDASTPSQPSVSTVPNTTITTTTVTTGLSDPRSVPIDNTAEEQNDAALFQQNETQLGSTIPSPPVSTAAEVTGDEAITAFEDAQAAELAAAEGSAFAGPPPVNTLDDPEARAIQDVVDADLAAQEGSAFPPVEEATPVGDEALQAIEDAEAAQLAAAEGSAFAEPPPVDPELDEQLARSTQAIEDASAAELATREGTAFAVPVDPAAINGLDLPPPTEAINGLDLPDDDSDRRVEAARFKARAQSTLQDRVNVPSAADWRVRLQLAKSADYLYRADDASLLKPLLDTDGVIFPYNPQIDTSYKANYEGYDLIHSNYRGYFYKSSSVAEITVKGPFTAQDTREAQYLLAVIHFFRSVTKMFYGKDPQRGVPPPLVYLSGYGQYQFNRHPCLVSNFQYSLPTDVDYIRADGFNNYGVNLENRRSLSSGPAPGGGLSFIKDKLKNNGLSPGGMPKPPGPVPVVQNVNNTNPVNSTYVPTKMDITVTLLPIQTRSQVSKQFSLQSFANGDLLKGGFW